MSYSEKLTDYLMLKAFNESFGFNYNNNENKELFGRLNQMDGILMIIIL